MLWTAYAIKSDLWPKPLHYRSLKNACLRFNGSGIWFIPASRVRIQRRAHFLFEVVFIRAGEATYDVRRSVYPYTVRHGKARQPGLGWRASSPDYGRLIDAGSPFWPRCVTISPATSRNFVLVSCE